MAKRSKSVLRPVLALLLLGAAIPAYPATTRLQVMARVGPTREAIASAATVFLLSPAGKRVELPLELRDKLALITRGGQIPQSVQQQAARPGVHVIEINY